MSLWKDVIEEEEGSSDRINTDNNLNDGQFCYSCSTQRHLEYYSDIKTPQEYFLKKFFFFAFCASDGSTELEDSKSRSNTGIDG